jgi:hypothetical protein
MKLMYFLSLPWESTRKGAQSVPIETAGSGRRRLTVMLGCTAAGEKLKPYLIFPGVAPKSFKRQDNDPNTVWGGLVASQEAGNISNKLALGVKITAWMNTVDYNRWINNCYQFKPGHVAGVTSNSLRLVPTFVPHKDQGIANKLEVLRCTSYLRGAPASCSPWTFLSCTSSNVSFVINTTLG